MGGHQFSDALYATLHKAYADGEYDGYWQQPRRTGTFTNSEWTYYLRGYLAGVKERQEGPSDEVIQQWAQDLARDVAGGER